jgi:predicted phage-related endonuclease
MEAEHRITWLKERRGGVGGSDIPALSGLTHYPKTALDVYLEKTDTSEPDDAEIDGPAAWGLDVEASILKTAARKLGVPFRAYGAERPLIFKHRDEPIARCSPDAIVEGEHEGKRCGISAKSTVARVFESQGWGDEWTSACRDDAWAQAQWEMGILDLDRMFVACGVLDRREVKLYVVDHDPEVFAGLLGLARRFWNEHVIPGVPPPTAPDDVKTWAKLGPALARMYREESGEVFEAAPDIQAAARRYNQLATAIKNLETEKDATENMLRAALGAAVRAEWGDWKPKGGGRKFAVTCKEQGFVNAWAVIKEIAERDPALHAVVDELKKKHTKTTRVIRVNSEEK